LEAVGGKLWKGENSTYHHFGERIKPVDHEPLNELCFLAPRSQSISFARFEIKGALTGEIRDGPERREQRYEPEDIVRV
jgi:hypothetical protein